jgi:NLR family CARD domain-containing protein 3
VEYLVSEALMPNPKIFELTENIDDYKNVNVNLTVLDLSVNPLGNSGVESLCEFLQDKRSKLKHLDLSECKITNKGTISLFNSLAFQKSLRILKLNKNTIGCGSSAYNDGPVVNLVQCFSEERFCLDLEELHVENCNIGNQDVRALSRTLRGNNALKVLMLKKNPLSMRGLEPLMESLGSKSCKLETLDLSGTQMCDDCSRVLAKQLTVNTRL